MNIEQVLPYWTNRYSKTTNTYRQLTAIDQMLIPDPAFSVAIPDLVIETNPLRVELA